MIEEIRAAHERIKPFIHRTPVLTCATLDKLCGASVYLKCENFQKIGAFKFRGACNVLAQLTPEERARGVVAHSSGNHAQAVALAARLHGVQAHIVMPANPSAVKRAATEGYGATVTVCEEAGLGVLERTCKEVLEQTGGVLVHPYDDPRIIAGAGTAALELLEEVPDLTMVMAPVSGGGLLSGTALASVGLKPDISVIGCEPLNADDACRSLHTGARVTQASTNTIADGLRGCLSERTFAIVTQHVRDIVTATEEEIIAAMRWVWERVKIVIEPSSAVAFAPLLFDHLNVRGERVGVIVSGGNVDLSALPF